MQKKPPAKPKPRRKAPPPKAGAGREGGLRAKGAPVVRRFKSETEENKMTKLAQMRRANFSGQPRRRPRVSSGASSSFYVNSPTKKPTK